jgi:cold shock CspA family protein
MSQNLSKISVLDLDSYADLGSTTRLPDATAGQVSSECFTLKCQLKWFKFPDGYGFVQIVENPGLTWISEEDDVFIHSSKCELSQLSKLKPGDFLYCKIVKGVRGPQVEEVYGYTPIPEQVTMIKGVVKWFNQQKNFGFLTGIDDSDPVANGRDVFLAGARLQQLSIESTELHMNRQVLFSYKLDQTKDRLIVSNLELL